MSPTSAATSVARSNDEILDWLQCRRGAFGRRRGAGGALVVLQRAGYAGRRCRFAEPVLERCRAGAAAIIATIVGEGLADFITALGPSRRVLIVGPAPELKHPLENCLQRAQLTGQPQESCAIKRSDVERRHRETWQVLRGAAAKFPNVRLIDPAECSATATPAGRSAPRTCTTSTRTISACSAPRCCTGTSSAISDGCMATGRRSDGRSAAHIALTMVSVIFLASPSSIMVLSR